jgi:acyl-CoA synthetase (AMP-forming)/AMP-acid ligase II
MIGMPYLIPFKRAIFEHLADSITYLTDTLGILRAGYTAFVISTRNSAVAVAHLLSTVEVAHVLVGEEHSLQNLAAESLDLMRASNAKIPGISHMPLFEEVYNDEKEAFLPLPCSRPNLDEPAVILHTSG